jgi:hypothetical protein
MLGMNSMGNLTALSTFRLMLLKNKVVTVAIEIGNYIRFYDILQGKTRYLSLRQIAVTMVGCSCVWSVCLSLPPLFGWGQYLPEENGMR